MVSTLNSLSALPPELLARICDFMEVESKKEILAFAKSSRQFYAVALPFLYRHIDLISTPTSAENAAYRIEAITKYFLQHPELAVLVRHLAIRPQFFTQRHQQGWPLDPEFQDAVRRILSPDAAAPPGVQQSSDPPSAEEELASSHALDVLPGAEDAEDGSDDAGSEWDTTDSEDSEDDADLTNGGDFEADQWIYLAQEDRRCRRDVVLVCLLSCLPRLETLDLELSFHPGRAAVPIQRLLNRMIAKRGLAPFTTPPLAHLRSVCFGYPSPDDRGELWLGPHLLPGLTSLYLHRISGPWYSWNRSVPGKSRSLDITHLELRDCRIPPTLLRNFLAGPKALKSFIYVIGEPHTDLEMFEPISYKSVRVALEQQKDSLEQIWIDYPHDYAFDESSTEHTGPMGSFSSFTKLKHLHIAGTYLFGFVWTEDVDTTRLVRALPEQIETVHISHGDEDEETVAGISYVVDAKELGRFEMLRELKVDASLQWINEKRDELKELIDRAKDTDLNIMLFNNHSNSRIQHFEDWIEWARDGLLETNRVESPWGFDGDVVWPDRISGCMKQPVYEKIEVAGLLSRPFTRAAQDRD